MEQKDFYYILLTEERQEVPVTIAEFEAWMPPQTVPQFRAKWTAMKSQILEGDELWMVCAAQRDWDRFAGAEWISHRRNGKEINQLVIIRNQMIDLQAGPSWVVRHRKRTMQVADAPYGRQFALAIGTMPSE